ncbi:MAG: hypothetical protein WC783_05665, partial [Candidatus Paceibacterota bacterium]
MLPYLVVAVVSLIIGTLLQPVALRMIRAEHRAELSILESLLEDVRREYSDASHSWAAQLEDIGVRHREELRELGLTLEAYRASNQLLIQGEEEWQERKGQYLVRIDELGQEVRRLERWKKFISRLSPGLR